MQNLIAPEEAGGPYGMNRTFKAAVAALIFAVGFAGLVIAGPFEDAVAAYNNATALRLLRPLESLRGDPSTFVVIIVAVAFLAGRFSKRSTRRTSLGSRAELARQAWWKRRWRRDQAWTSEGVVPFNPGVSPVTDPAEQLRFVWPRGLKNAASSHGRRLTFYMPPKGQLTRRTSSGV